MKEPLDIPAHDSFLTQEVVMSKANSKLFLQFLALLILFGISLYPNLTWSQKEPSPENQLQALTKQRDEVQKKIDELNATPLQLAIPMAIINRNNDDVEPRQAIINQRQNELAELSKQKDRTDMKIENLLDYMAFEGRDIKSILYNPSETPLNCGDILGSVCEDYLNRLLFDRSTGLIFLSVELFHADNRYEPNLKLTSLILTKNNILMANSCGTYLECHLWNQLYDYDEYIGYDIRNVFNMNPQLALHLIDLVDNALSDKQNNGAIKNISDWKALFTTYRVAAKNWVESLNKQREDDKKPKL
jgi:hypothetical protein